MISRLVNAIEEKHSPIVVGLDPTLQLIPPQILESSFAQYGQTLEAAADAIFVFNKELVDAVRDLVPAFKPQIAMYEQFGVPGVAAFAKTVAYCHEKGTLVLGDVKRGDIGSTSEAYAKAHIGTIRIGEQEFAPFGEDFMTVNPYFGIDGIKPFTDVCKSHGKGIFVLVKTSNPSGGEFQDRLVDGRPLYELVGEHVADWGKDVMDGEYSEVGAVVGATYPEEGARMREVMPHALILVPGYGAQGASGKDLAPFFHPGGRGAIVNSSRGIIGAWKKEEYKAFGAERFGEAARAAVLSMREDLNANIS